MLSVCYASMVLASPAVIRYSGQVGYMLLGMRNSREAHIGDTLHLTGSKVTLLPGFRAAKPMVGSTHTHSHTATHQVFPVLRTLECYSYHVFIYVPLEVSVLWVPLEYYSINRCLLGSTPWTSQSIRFCVQRWIN